MNDRDHHVRRYLVLTLRWRPPTLRLVAFFTALLRSNPADPTNSSARPRDLRYKRDRESIRRAGTSVIQWDTQHPAGRHHRTPPEKYGVHAAIGQRGLHESNLLYQVSRMLWAIARLTFWALFPRFFSNFYGFAGHQGVAMIGCT